MAKKTDPEILRQRLASLPADTLADALLSLSLQGGVAEAMVVRLTATSHELVKRINSRLAGFRRRRKFLFRSQAPELAAELSDLLSDIEAAALTPEQGMRLVAKFLQLDGKVFDICDDSYGAVGAVFHGEVPEVFWRYASAVADENTVVEVLVELLLDDPWSTRSELLDQAPEFLTGGTIERLAEVLWQRAQEQHLTDPEHGRWASQVMHLASVCGDPDRYRNAALLSHRESWAKVELTADGLTHHDALEVARLQLMRGQATEALSLIQEVSAKKGQHRREECEKLLQQAHGALGNRTEEASTARRRFDAAPSADALDELLAVIGDTERPAVVEETLAAYIQAERLSLTGLKFMLELERPDLAATQIITHASELDGEQYYFLPAIADQLIQSGEHLAASLILRALVAANLDRALAKYYSHGVRYLVLAGRIATAVDDWGDQPDHGRYFAELQEQHKRKVSFWKKFMARKK